MTIGENQFKIPYTYAFPMHLGGEIQMIIRCNFIRAMQGGLRIEVDVITFYKNVTVINTQQQAIISSFTEEIDDLEYIQLQEAVIYTAGPTPQHFKVKFQPIMEKLKEAGYIGEDPLKHWSKNKVVCKITLKNPDFIIEDRPLNHVTPQMKKSFKGHISSFLKLGVIRPSQSQHRTTAIIVYSGTTQDPKTGEVKKGKERLVFNYKRLNDNTEQDQYSLPEFLGAIIGNGEIRLQPNIIKRIVEKQDADLTTKSGLQSWLGILNYARNFIPNLGRLLAPL
ncbi:Polyprotein P3 [Nymphaea thermarum]|nr:Polyprotein P3 [Nymphaea thermarum]